MNANEKKLRFAGDGSLTFNIYPLNTSSALFFVSKPAASILNNSSKYNTEISPVIRPKIIKVGLFNCLPYNL